MSLRPSQEIERTGYGVRMSDRPPMTDLDTIAKTLRFVASWMVAPNDEYDEASHYDQVEHLVSAAEIIEAGETRQFDACCPLCEELACDQGCPMEPHRWDYYYH